MNAVEGDKSTIQAIKQVLPAVVSIVMEKHLSDIKKSLGPWAQIFGGPGTEVLPHPQKGRMKKKDDVPSKEDEEVRIGGGSGICVSSDGLILTNKHVVFDPGAEYFVLRGEEELSAKVLCRDPVLDIAILKIDAKDVPAARLGSSHQLQLGQTVIAIGTALGLFTNSVSKGIVSGLGRKITASLGTGEETEQLRGVIQTDVAINQGNSGGPLINLEGDVVGINTAVIMGAQNIGFALPIDWAKRDLQDIQKYGRVVKPYVGLRYAMVTKELQKRLNLPLSYGALVIRDHMPDGHAVIPNSPADKAGLKEGDLITAVGGTSLEKFELLDALQEFQVGDEVETVFLRGGKEQTARLKLEERK